MLRKSLFLFVLAGLVSHGTVHAGVFANPVFTTEADIAAQNLLPPTPSPLPDITQFTASGSTSGVFTNQTSGVAGVVGGIRTVFAAPITNAIDGVAYNLVAGATPGTTLVAFAALDGALVGPGSASFSAGRLFIAETTGAFDRRDPSSWGFGGATILETFELSFAPAVLPGSNGTGIVPVPAPGQNKSLPDGLTIGDTDFNFLSMSLPGGSFLTNVEPASALPINPEYGLFIEGEQDLDTDGRGLDVDVTAPGFVLDGVDLGVLNSIAGLALLTDLGGAGTGFATGLGVASVTPTADFFMDPFGLQSGTGEGDLVATTNEMNFNPVIEGVIPEPSSVFAWIGLVSIAGVSRRRRNKA